MDHWHRILSTKKCSTRFSVDLRELNNTCRQGILALMQALYFRPNSHGQRPSTAILFITIIRNRWFVPIEYPKMAASTGRLLPSNCHCPIPSSLCSITPPSPSRSSCKAPPITPGRLRQQQRPRPSGQVHRNAASPLTHHSRSQPES
jgi:hypothetical protein